MISFRRSRLPAEVMASLAEATPGRVLVWAQGDDGAVAVALDEAFAVRDRTAAPWQVWGWHLLQGGGWDKQSGTLRWVTNAGERGSLTLDEPARLPEVFNERVMASIVVQQGFDAPGGGRISVAGRRRLAGAAQRGPMVWQTLAQGHASLEDPVVAQFAIERAKELAEQYDL